MAGQEALFEDEPTYGVGELSARITRAMAAAFPAEVWVRGEVDGLRPPNANGHVYFSLCERNSRRGPTSTVAVALFRTDRLRVERTLREWPGFALADGIEVRVRGRVQYAYNRVQLVMSAVDPVHTLGRLAADRDRVLRALAADGLLEANRRLPMPTVPLHVGLVTSAGSAAYEDVVGELRASGIGFRITVADARVQGHGAEASLLRALTELARARPDVVLLVRGGGARTDLATFDGERLARAVAALPVPLLTGVGHETDSCVVDEVAHRAFKTPTACAAAVVEQVRAAVERAEAAWAGVGRLARAGPDLARAAVDGRATRLAERASAAVDDAAARLERHAGWAGGVARVRLAAADHALDAACRRLDRGAHDAAARAEGALAVADARAAAADPARALARGWSLTRTADGRLVRAVADLTPGATVDTTFVDGRARSTIIGVDVAPEGR